MAINWLGPDGDAEQIEEPEQNWPERDWPASQVELWSIDRLKPYAQNARKHSERQVAQIAASIERNGWTVPVLVDEEGEVLAGHGRLQAAQRLGDITAVPVMVARGWTKEQKRAYRLADNKLGLEADWDREVLISELQSLDGDDLKLTAFSDKELSKLFGNEDGQPQLSDNLSYAVVVRCDGEQQQRELLERFEREGMRCEALIS